MYTESSNHHSGEKIVIRHEDLDPPIAEPSSKQPPQESSGSLSASIATIFFVATGLFLFVWTRNPTSSTPEASQEPVPQAAATLKYWNSLRELSAKLRTNPATEATNPSFAQLATLLGRLGQTCGEVSTGIAHLAVTNVDPEAVEVGTSFMEVLGEREILLNAMERLVIDAKSVHDGASSVDTMVEAIIRGFYGDPLGTHDRLVAAFGKLGERHQRLLGQLEALERRQNVTQGQITRTRAALTARYGVEFPPF